MDKSNVKEERWEQESFYNELSLTKNILHKAEEYDVNLIDDTSILTYMSASTPDVSKNYAVNFPDVNGMGGPTYVQLQERVAIKQIDHSDKKLGAYTDYIDTTYPDSSNLEFYFYRQPFVKKIEPLSGLA